MTRSNSRSKAIAFRLVALLIGIVLSYAMLEIAARVILWRQGEYIDTLRNAGPQASNLNLTLFDIVKPSADHRRVYELLPGARGNFVGQPLQINKQGFRDQDFQTSKPAGTTRIAILGDSVAFGWGVAETARFGNLLPALLKNRPADGKTSTGLSGNVQIYNFAVPGYNTAMELATWKDVVAGYDPDVLVLSLVGNDADLPNFVRARPKLWSLRKSFIVQAIRDQLKGRKIGDTARMVIGGLVETSPDKPDTEIPPEYRDIAGLGPMRTALAELLKICREKHIRPMCVVQSRVSKPTAQAMAVNEDRDLAITATALGWPVCDPTQDIIHELDAAKVPADALWVSKDDMHPNPKAHEIIAKDLAKALIEN